MEKIEGLNFEFYLKELGFIPHRVKKDGSFVKDKDRNHLFFSSMIPFSDSPSFLYRIWIKNDIKIWWGMHEFGKPPTLIFPKPKISNIINILKKDREIDVHSDDFINRILQKNKAKDIFESLFSDNINLKYFD